MIHVLPKETWQVLRADTQITGIDSVLRELLQNAVDAGASTVDVSFSIKKNMCMVADDGCGMTRKDLDLLGRPHITSKIRNFRDLERFGNGNGTMGFRGEAIFAISQISELTMMTKHSDFRAHYWRDFPMTSVLTTEEDIRSSLHAQYLSTTPFYEDIWARSSGTVVIVSDLFKYMPVRKKTLENVPVATITDSIREDFYQILVRNPNLKLNVFTFDDNYKNFEFLHDAHHVKEQYLHSLGSIPIHNAFIRVYGHVVPDPSIKIVKLSFREYNITGLISNCQVRSKSFQFVFVNGRRYSNSEFLGKINRIFDQSTFATNAIEKDTRLGKRSARSYPLFVIKIDGPAHVQDLIQSTSKDIIYLSDGKLINILILKVIYSFLKDQGFLTEIPTQLNDDNCDRIDQLGTLEEPIFMDNDFHRDFIIRNNVKMAEYNKVSHANISHPWKRQRLDYPVRRTSKWWKERSVNELHQSRISTKFAPIKKWAAYEKLHVFDYKDRFLSRSDDLKEVDVVNQVDQKFILLRQKSARGNFELYIIDQHACDERIRLESFLKQYICDIMANALAVQKIFQSRIEIAISEKENFEQYRHEFSKWGIYYNVVHSNNNYSLDIFALPDMLADKIKANEELKDMMLQHIFDLKDGSRSRIKTISSLDAQFLSGGWWSNVNKIPSFIRRFFDSKACRSAIMFGDTLNLQECRDLVRRLNGCIQPNFCAHGRPSVVELICHQHQWELKNFTADYDYD